MTATASAGPCVVAILLGSSQTAQRLLEVRLGQETALAWGLRRWTLARRPQASVLILPASVEAPWRERIAAAAAPYGVGLHSAGHLDPAGLVAEVMEAHGAAWAGLIPAANALFDGRFLDSCLGLVAHVPADFVRGAGYPLGAGPLLVNGEAARALAIPAPAWEGLTDERSLGQRLASLSGLRGIEFPAPGPWQAPDLDLSLNSPQTAAELELAASRLTAEQLEITPAAVIRTLANRQRARVRAVSRLAQLRPRASSRRAAGQARAGILCLYFRSDKLGGGETSLDNLRTGLDRGRFQPLLASPSPSGALVEAWRADGLPTLPVPVLGWPPQGQPSEVLLAAMQLARFASRHGADLVCAGDSLTSSRLGALVATLLGLPLVTRILADPGQSGLEASLAVLADRVAVPSHYVAECCQRLGLPADRLRVVHEGVAAQWLEPAPAAEDVRHWCGYASDAPLIGVVSRLGDPAKALDRAIQAAALIAAECPAARMVICGKTPAELPPAEPALTRQIEALGLQGRVRLAGFFPDLRGIYPQFDLLLHPAPHEPFGLVLTEAMAMGVPLVAVAGGGVPEQVRSGEHGLLVERNEPARLAQAALQLLAQPALRRQFGQQAREHVRRHLTGAQFARRLEAVFDELLFSTPSVQGARHVDTPRRSPLSTAGQYLPDGDRGRNGSPAAGGRHLLRSG